MKTIKNNEGVLPKPAGKAFSPKYKMMRGYRVERRKQKEKFDKNCLSETDMDEILAIG